MAPDSSPHAMGHPRGRSPLFRIPLWIAFAVFLAAAAFFLWTEHRAHLLGALPYALLLACVVVHFFMHGGHGNGGHGGKP